MDYDKQKAREAVKATAKHTPTLYFRTQPDEWNATADCGCEIVTEETGCIAFRQCPLHAAAPDLLAMLETVDHVFASRFWLVKGFDKISKLDYGKLRNDIRATLVKARKEA